MVNWPAREADHSLPQSAEVTNDYSYTSTPLYVFMAAKRRLITFLRCRLVQNVNIRPRIVHSLLQPGGHIPKKCQGEERGKRYG